MVCNKSELFYLLKYFRIKGVHGPFFNFLVFIITYFSTRKFKIIWVGIFTDSRKVLRTLSLYFWSNNNNCRWLVKHWYTSHQQMHEMDMCEWVVFLVFCVKKKCLFKKCGGISTTMVIFTSLPKKTRALATQVSEWAKNVWCLSYRNQTNRNVWN